MPRQVSGIVIEDEGEVYRVNIGDFGYPVQKSLFLRRPLDEDLVKHNLRLAYLIGGYAHPASKEFLEAIRGKSVNAGDRDYFITGFELEDVKEQLYRIYIGPQRGVEMLGFPVTWEFLKSDPLDDSVIVRNLSTWNRMSAITAINTTTLSRIRAAAFWK
jgi:hypothetical protein